jgi:hypothetical protein
MKIHRIREAKSTDGIDKPHLFVEFEEDSWMEVKELPSHESIEGYNEDSRQHGLMMYDTRAFEVGIIKDWIEIESIKDYNK